MGIFLDRLRHLNELQIDGQDIDDNDDYTMDDEEDDAATEAPADAAQDDAEETNAADNAEVDAADGTDDEEDDFTLDDTDAEDTEATEGDAAEEQPAPDQREETNGATGVDTTADAPAGGDDAADDNFTMDDNNTGGGDTEGGAEGGEDAAPADGGDQGNNNAGGEKIENPTDEIADADAKAAEEQIYDSLTDDQKRIRVLQLKIDYKDLYETIINTIEGVNNIPKNMDNIETIKKLTEYLTKCKNILIDYVENVFDQNPYLENYATYLKYMAIFRTVAKVMEEMNKAKEK